MNKNQRRSAGALLKHYGKRYFITAMGAMAQGLFASLLIGTILATLGEQLGIPVFQMGQTNPVDIAKAAVEHAKQHGNDMVFLDTAGRLHVDEALMDELKNIINVFHFPFSSTEEPQLVFGYFSNDVGITVENQGDVECGLTIELYARSPVTNPKIYNYITQEFIGLNYSMETADLITIDTRKGEKTVTLLRDGVETNIFNYVMKNSTWLQLEASGSTFVYEVASGVLGDLLVTFKHSNQYEGV